MTDSRCYMAETNTIKNKFFKKQFNHIIECPYIQESDLENVIWKIKKKKASGSGCKQKGEEKILDCILTFNKLKINWKASHLNNQL